MNKILFLFLLLLTNTLMGAEDTLVNRNFYYIKTRNNKYLVPNYNFSRVELKDETEPDARVQVLKNSVGKIIFRFEQTRYDRNASGYLHTADNKKLYFSNNPSSFESYEIVKNEDGKYYIKSWQGYYLTANNEQDILTTREGEPSYWQTFEFIKVQPCAMRPIEIYDGDSRFFHFIKTNSNKFVIPNIDGSEINLSNDPIKRGKVEIINTTNNQFVLKFPEGYLHTAEGGTLYLSYNASSYESYQLEKQENGRYFIKTYHKTYLTSDAENNSLNGTNEGPSYSEQFELIPADQINPDKKEIISLKKKLNAQKEENYAQKVQIYNTISSARVMLKEIKEILSNNTIDESTNNLKSVIQLWRNIENSNQLFNQNLNNSVFQNIHIEINKLNIKQSNIENLIRNISLLISQYDEKLQSLNFQLHNVAVENGVF